MATSRSTRTPYFRCDVCQVLENMELSLSGDPASYVWRRICRALIRKGVSAALCNIRDMRIIYNCRCVQRRIDARAAAEGRLKYPEVFRVFQTLGALSR